VKKQAADWEKIFVKDISYTYTHTHIHTQDIERTVKTQYLKKIE
jgi:hypothetical protein